MPDPLPEELSPSRFIEKVSLRTGQVVDEEIRPHQLLVHEHRDYHVVDIHARYMMSRVIKATGDEEWARTKMRRMRRLGQRTSAILARAIGQRDPEKVAKALFGLKEKEYFFRYKKRPHTTEEVAKTLERLRDEATSRLREALENGSGVRVLLTGGTGFVGKELLAQAADDDEIAEVVVLIRPKEIRDRKTGELIGTLSPARRGEELLDQLWLRTPERRSKFRFIAGDVEEPRLGISDADFEELLPSVTHVIHCAASVAFDDPYEKSFRANVRGTLNALRFSEALSQDPASPFVAHLAIETSYIHGRQVAQPAREDEIVFPRNFYNNYYELTKAMASIETERFMLDKGLRVVQLCPAIVIGDSRAGNNRGDMKVVNAPVNVFGRAHEATKAASGKRFERSKVNMIARLACIFPGDPSARINLIPVDRVVQGILAALGRPQAVGERIHLATDNHITSEQIQYIVESEVGVKVRLAEPTLHRTLTLPLLTKVLTRLKQERVATGLQKLGTIFGGYSEWGQPIHEVGNDVRILGLSEKRPNTLHAFRMLCRHNRYVQEFGKVRDLAEISRREEIWLRFVEAMEKRNEMAAGATGASQFREELEAHLDLDAFEPRVQASSDEESQGER